MKKRRTEPKLGCSLSSRMASTALSPELVCGHMLVQVDILEKAVNELDARQVKAAAEQDAKHIKAVAESEAKQSAAMQLVQSLLTQMTELRKELRRSALTTRLSRRASMRSLSYREARAVPLGRRRWPR
jgi:hypothetical protein